MLSTVDPENILFLDIETVPAYKDFDLLSPEMKALWDHKAKKIAGEQAVAENEYHKAGIYAEFGKIICISVGFLKLSNNKYSLRIKSFAGNDEASLLKEFCNLLNTHYNSGRFLLCAHNGKEFDFPYISRRLLINQIPLPILFQTQGKKPWEIQHLDTMELWKFGDYKNYTSLALLAEVFGIESPKDDIKGSDVCKVYWQENNLERIVVYCQKDVITIVQIMMKFMFLPTIESDSISIV